MKTYPCICGICGTRFSIQALFMAAVTKVMNDGTSRLIVSGYCPEKHAAREVEAAWKAGFPALKHAA